MDTDYENLVFAPAPLVDVVGALLAGEALLATLAPDDPRRERVRWRVLDLRLRIDPGWVLAELDRQPPPDERREEHERLRAEALIGLTRADEAEAIVARHADDPGAAWLQMRGQLAQWRGDTLRARELFDQAVAAAAEDPERKAMVMVLRIAARSKLGERDIIPAEAEELDKLLVAHGAGISAALASHNAAVATLPDPEEVVVRFSVICVEENRRRLTQGYEKEQASIGPVPLHVHAILRRYLRDRDLLVREVFNMAGLQYRAKQPGEAYATLYYAAQIGRRMLDEATALRLGEGLVAFAEVLGPEEAARQRTYVEERQRVYLSSVRPREQS